MMLCVCNESLDEVVLHRGMPLARHVEAFEVDYGRSSMKVSLGKASREAGDEDREKGAWESPGDRQSRSSLECEAAAEEEIVPSFGKKETSRGVDQLEGEAGPCGKPCEEVDSAGEPPDEHTKKTEPAVAEPDELRDAEPELPLLPRPRRLEVCEDAPVVAR